MDPERWQQIQQIFNRALARPSEEWPALLDQACGDDRELRREVEELLRAEAEAEGAIEAAVAGGAELLAGELPTVADLTAELPATEATIPERFGKYAIEAQVGQGGFGVVYKGRDPVLRRTVAIKTCSSLDAKLRKRFFREAQLAAGLQHPNITTVHDLGVEDGVPYLVQEFLPGEDLDHLIERRSELSTAAKLDILLQIARGLEHAHGEGVLHRDVKPANVRILTRGGVKIMDFGIAKLLGSHTRLTGTGMAIGTVGYLAPEQMRSKELDERADVFSFGVLAYELLTFERPFQGDDFSQVSYQLLYVDPPPVEERWPAAAPGSGCPSALGAIVRRCLEKDRRRRYRDFSQVIADLEPLHQLLRSPTGPDLERTRELPAAVEPAAGEPTSGDPPVGGPRHRRRWIAAAAAVLVALAAVWLLRSWDRAGDVDRAVVARQEEDAVPGRAEEPPPSRPESAGEPAVEAPAAEPRAAEPTETRDAPSPAPPETARTAPERGSPAAGTPDRGSPAPRAGGREIREAVPEPPPAAVETPPEAPSVSSPAPAEADPSAPVAVAPPSGTPPPTTAPGPAAARRGALLTPGPGVVPPRLLEQPKPEYPRRARRRRKQARILVRVLVDENGRVAQAIAPGPDPFGFSRAARAAALKARYEAATRDGIPGKMWTELPFEFRLQ